VHLRKAIVYYGSLSIVVWEPWFCFFGTVQAHALVKFVFWVRHCIVVKVCAFGANEKLDTYVVIFQFYCRSKAYERFLISKSVGAFGTELQP